MKSWKTTAIGVATGGIYLLCAYFQNGHITPTDISLALGSAGLGLVAKDADVSHSPAPLPKAESVSKPEQP